MISNDPIMSTEKWFHGENKNKMFLRVDDDNLAFYIPFNILTHIPASILYKSIADRYRPVSYPDAPITARYIFIKNAYWDQDDGRVIMKGSVH